MVKFSGLSLLFLFIFGACQQNGSHNVHLPPFPYELITNKSDPGSVQALVFGDEMAADFMRFAPVLTSKWQEQKSINFNFKHIGSSKDGLHRSLNHFISLKKTPKFIFYFVGNHELYEKKFNTKDSKNIQANLEKFRLGKWTTVGYFFPFLQDFIYPKVDKITLTDEIIQDKTEYSHGELIDLYTTNFEIYQTELETFIRTARKNQNHLYIVTNPININWAPEVICGVQTSESQALLKKVEYYIYTGEVKRAQGLLFRLFKEIPSNARVHYLLGQTNLKMGNYLQAKGNFIASNSLDCNRLRGNVVYNALAKKLAKQYNIPVLDFFHEVNNELGAKEIFKDDRLPEDYFYKKLTKKIWNELSPMIKF